MSSKPILLLSFLCCLLYFSAGAFACKCGQYEPSPQKALKEFHEHINIRRATIFLGKVVAVEENMSGKRVTFQAVQWWDTAVPENVQVSTGFSGDTCGYHFEIEKNYLVFATAHQQNFWHVSLCSPTTDNPAPFLKVLGQGSKPMPVVPKSVFVLYNLIGITLICGIVGYLYLLTLREERRKQRKPLPPA